tara:strand:- start:403 stop:666 length:264 start_codon:yes stop_codon:yes gene_type:complete
MCREKGAVKHDDRLDCLAQGVKYFTDAMSINAIDAIKMRRRDEWNSLLQDFLTSPTRSANHLVLGMNKDQRDEANGLDGDGNTPTWV